MRLISLLTIFVMLGLNISLSAQVQKNPKRFYIENGKKKYVQLPFKLINNLVVLPVFVNHSDTLNFILDSGLSNTIITDKELADRLNMRYLKELKMYGFGSGIALSALHSIENTVRLPGITGEHQDVIVIPDPDFDFSKLLGIKVHGLLGYNLFRDLIVEINYDSRYITFYTPRSYEYRNRRRVTTLPLTIIDTKPFITAGILQENDTRVDARFLIDSGASFALWIDLRSDSGFVLPQRNEPVYLGTGLGGAVYARAGRIKEFGDGKMKLEHVIASYPDTSLTATPLYDDHRNGTIGADILSRFNIIFDYRNGKISFYPNSKTKDAFEINLSGMEICCPSPGENLFNISTICEDSPACKAGLKAGDQVLCINFQDLSKMSLSEVHALLLKKQGRKMNVIYKRDGKVNSVNLIMTDCI